MFDALLIPMRFIMGALWGSFGNVCILRMPEGKSVVWPGSRCPKCGADIRWFDNVPMLSWLLLRGRCRSCKGKISVQYPLVELLMSALFGLAAYRLGWGFNLFEAWVLIFGLVVLTFIDLKHMIIPDRISLPGLVLGLVFSLFSESRSFLDSLLGVLLGGGFFFAIAWLYATLRKREGLGGGDIKLLAALGAFLGWASIPYIILVSSLVGTVVGLLLILAGGKGMKAEIPFGPYLALAGLFLLLGQGTFLTEWYAIYLGFFGF